MPAVRRNHRADVLPVQESPPPWGPVEIRSLRDRLRQADADERGRTEAAWDLIVVGAGIAGAGVARDAALRGLRVLVLDARDLAFGTSSRSSRLIHGGVRYLEQGELGLVYEALRERRLLYKIAGHIVQPARFLFPAYRGDRLPLWKLRIGLSLYDALSLYRSHGHRVLRPAAARALEPLLREEGLRGAVTYEDAVTDDARLTLATLQDARRHGAQVLTYAPVVAIRRADDDQLVELDGGLRVRARAVVVAAGPWTSERLLGVAGAHLLALSRGIHLVLRAADVPIRQPLVVQAQKERRILFVVPWGARTYLGTTDTAYEGDPAASGVTASDTDELFALIGKVLPGAVLGRERIVSAWSGVRPLVRDEHADPGDPTAEISRSHRIVETAEGVIAVVGGKLTTYRSMAEETVDRVIRRLRQRGRLPAGVGRCQTHRHPLVAGEPLSPLELQNPLLGDLAQRHGPLARDLHARIEADPRLGARIVEDLPYCWAEVDHAISHEGAVHLEDVLRRRIPLALTDADLGARVAREVATRLVTAWGGGAADIEAELQRYREAMRVETGRVLAPC
ncbi:glycerol-3-phosphate dehydrogenase/oxidase [Nannocystis pusilla]|uniref:glycerol-3-phosphate dehydrogenase/oxidase n=1 Tax=Nannocystis pusilla TaxID=889268 RepID=UPI001CC8F1A3|nr:glycerol-3-phosphate dehydrogenase/oxidase [Nannocystis pusilla]